jgi:hypothetical protein
VTHCQDGTIRINVYAGVPQGSILGPLLWNLVYDGFLRKVETVKDTVGIAYADDLALVLTMRKAQEIGGRVRETMQLVTNWCKGMGLHLAQEKSGIILLTGKRFPKILKIDVGGGEITTRNTIKYLGGAIGQCQEVFSSSGTSVR